MKQAPGQRRALVTPLKLKYIRKLITSMVDIGKRWKEHFLDLLNRDNYVNQSALDPPWNESSYL